jgi:hypothetical protein
VTKYFRLASRDGNYSKTTAFQERGKGKERASPSPYRSTGTGTTDKRRAQVSEEMVRATVLCAALRQYHPLFSSHRGMFTAHLKNRMIHILVSEALSRWSKAWKNFQTHESFIPLTLLNWATVLTPTRFHLVQWSKMIIKLPAVLLLMYVFLI